ncbi:MAG: hypothetical protein L0K86_09375 [Actinomycetia bacterium]|nr:hypothetical protein [Actinomycetes bacterium]
MRRLAGVVLALLGLGVAVVGAALAIWVGTDDRAVSGPHEIDADGVAVVTAPDAITWADATVTLDADVPGDKPVFIGVGNSVDVEDYLGDTRAVRVDSVRIPWEIDTSEQEGRQSLPASPIAVGWWDEQAGGMGGAVLEFELPEETVSVAVLAIGDNDLSGLTITASYHVRGGFVAGLGAVALGVGLMLAALVVWRGRVRSAVVDDDGYVYVYYDEEGRERLVPLDELDEYDIVDLTGEKYET